MGVYSTPEPIALGVRPRVGLCLSAKRGFSVLGNEQVLAVTDAPQADQEATYRQGRPWVTTREDR